MNIPHQIGKITQSVLPQPATCRRAKLPGKGSRVTVWDYLLLKH